MTRVFSADLWLRGFLVSMTTMTALLLLFLYHTRNWPFIHFFFKNFVVGFCACLFLRLHRKCESCLRVSTSYKFEYGSYTICCRCVDGALSTLNTNHMHLRNYTKIACKIWSTSHTSHKQKSLNLYTFERSQNIGYKMVH